MDIRNLALTIVTAALPLSGVAQGISDPTRPPPAFLSAVAGKGPPPAVPGAPEEGSAAKVQMLKIGPSQTYAVIGGKVVRLGGTVEGAKLVEVRPDSIVLQSPEGAKETISFYPGVTIKKVPEAADIAKAAKGKDSAKGTKKENR